MTESRDAPDWTGLTASDPGITTLQLFVYLGEALLAVTLVGALWRTGRRAMRHKPV
jgi:hypothetical protein